MIATLFIIFTIFIVCAILCIFSEDIILAFHRTEEDKERYRFACDIVDLKNTGKMGTRSEFARKDDYAKNLNEGKNANVNATLDKMREKAAKDLLKAVTEANENIEKILADENTNCIETGADRAKPEWVERVKELAKKTLWHYYDDNGNKIGVSSKELIALANQGVIRPGTVIESPGGTTIAHAKEVWGLIATPQIPS